MRATRAACVAISLYSGHYPQLGLPPSHSQQVCQLFETSPQAVAEDMGMEMFEAAALRAKALGYSLTSDLEQSTPDGLFLMHWSLYPASDASADPMRACQECFRAALIGEEAVQALGVAGADWGARATAGSSDVNENDRQAMAIWRHDLARLESSREARAIESSSRSKPAAPRRASL